MTKRYIKVFVTGVVTLGILITSFGQMVFAQGATYSCGTYSADNYSEGDCTTVKLPNTGLPGVATQSRFIIPMIIFGFMIITSVATMFILKRRKRKA